MAETSSLERLPECAPKVVTIGGGTGNFTILGGLKRFNPEISAIVNMTDNGGSTGDLRDELGVLPPGDIRQCLAALSQLPQARELLSIRFAGGGLKGHSFGNILLAAAEELHGGDFVGAVKYVSKLLQVKGNVIPVTTGNHTLVMYDGNEIIRGEKNISHRPTKTACPKIELDPPATINQEAERAISEADIILIAPGNLYGSILPVLAVGGVSRSIDESHASKVMISNLVNEAGQTDGWDVVKYVEMIERYLSEGVIDTVLYNTTIPDNDLLSSYASEGEKPVEIDESRFGAVKARFIGGDLLDRGIVQQNPADKLKRTLIRHNGIAVGRHIMRLYYS